MQVWNNPNDFICLIQVDPDQYWTGCFEHVGETLEEKAARIQADKCDCSTQHIAYNTMQPVANYNTNPCCDTPLNTDRTETQVKELSDNSAPQINN